MASQQSYGAGDICLIPSYMNVTVMTLLVWPSKYCNGRGRVYKYPY